MKRAVPNLITFAGLLCGVIGVALLSWPLLIASLALDLVDGAVARGLGASSQLGAALDITTDSILAHLLVWRVLGPSSGAAMISAGLIILQALWRAEARKLSGRSWVWSLLAFAVLAGGLR